MFLFPAYVHLYVLKASHANLVKLWLKSRCGKKNFEICDCCKFPYVYTDALTHKQIQEGNEIIH